MKLLSHVGELLEQEGYAVENIDATVIAQQPKLRPFIGQMEEHVAKALHLAKKQVNIKATTQEGVGFTGSQEGIAAQAACLLTGFYEGSAAVYGSGKDCQGCGGCGGASA